MSSLVLKHWELNPNPENSTSPYVKIVGRESGLLAWILSLVGVDPTTSIKVNANRVEFSSASLSGTEFRMIPLSGVCSTYYGYHKPWKAAGSIILLSAFLGFSAMGNSVGFGMFLILLGLICGLVYYFLNRSLTLGFVEQSGVVSGIKFKRSVIENVDIDSEEAKKVCIVIQRLVERKIQSASSNP